MYNKEMIGISGKKWIINPYYKDFFSNNIANNNISHTQIPINHKDHLNQVVDVITKSIKQNKKIGILGDYDVDGICSTSLFVNFLQQVQQNVTYEAVIPHRLIDGYGPSKQIIDYLLKKPVDYSYKSIYQGDQNRPADIIIFLDSGTTAHEMIDYIDAHGVTVIVIDHHAIESQIPKNCIFINSKQWNDNNYEYLCATGLAFIVLYYCNLQFNNKVNLQEMSDIVALATICDCVELTDLNNSLVRAGLDQLNSRPSSGLQALITYSERITEFYTHKDLGFFFGPILNAFGRMEHAIDGLDLLTNLNTFEQKKLALKGLFLNHKRKTRQTEILGKILSQLQKYDSNFICLADVLSDYKEENTWNFGIIGIISGRLKERFSKPVALFSHMCKNTEQNTAIDHHNCLLKGSFRSPIWFSVDQFIHVLKQNDVIINGGGHSCAGGCTLEVKNWQKLCDLFKQYTDNKLQEHKPQETLEIECITSIFALQNQKTYHNIQALLPFGPKKPQPLFQLMNYYGKLQVRRPKGVIYNISNILDSRDSTNIYIHQNHPLISHIESGHMYHWIVTPNLYRNKVQLELIDCLQVA